MLLPKRISFLGNNEFLSEEDYAAQCDEHFTNEIRRFKDGRSTSGRLLPKGCKNAVPMNESKMITKRVRICGDC